jgi:hypothetical protein
MRQDAEITTLVIVASLLAFIKRKGNRPCPGLTLLMSTEVGRRFAPICNAESSEASEALEGMLTITKFKP